MKHRSFLLFILIFCVFTKTLFAQKNIQQDKLDKIVFTDGNVQKGGVYFLYSNDREIEYCYNIEVCNKYKVKQVKGFIQSARENRPKKKYKVLIDQRNDTQISRLVYQGKYADFYTLYQLNSGGGERLIAITKPKSNEILETISDRFTKKKLFKKLSEYFIDLEDCYNKEEFNALPVNYEKFGLMEHMFMLTDKSLGLK